MRLLAQALDPARYRIEVVACFRKDGMPEQTHAQLEAIGVPVDRTPYALVASTRRSPISRASCPPTTSSSRARTSPTSIPRSNGCTSARR